MPMQSIHPVIHDWSFSSLCHFLTLTKYHNISAELNDRITYLKCGTTKYANAFIFFNYVMKGKFTSTLRIRMASSMY